MANDGRMNPRVGLNDFVVDIEIQGARVQAIILDVSEGGAQILLPKGTKSAVTDQIKVVFGNGIPDKKGQVRRSENSPANPNQVVIGVQFETAFNLALLKS